MKDIHVIWQQIPHYSIRDYSEVYGVVEGDYEEAEAILNYLNENDPDRPTYGNPRFWRESYRVLTLDGVKGDFT